MSAIESERRRARALAALDTTGMPPPPGTRPSREEIRRWIGGRVAPERAAEIDAHTALDPGLHAEWLALRLEALGDTPSEERRTLETRRMPPGSPRRGPSALVITALTVAAALAILVIDT